MGSSRDKQTPAPMTFHPHIADAFGLELAVLIDAAHRHQAGRGRSHRVSVDGRDVELRCFHWPWVSPLVGGHRLFRFSLLTDFPWWSKSTIQRLIACATGKSPIPRLVKRATDGAAMSPGRESTSNPHAAGRLGGATRLLLWQVSVRDAGRVSRDWYSVNYAAVGEGSSLFPAAEVGAEGPGRGARSGPSPWSDCPPPVVNLTTTRGQSDHAGWSDWAGGVGGKGGEYQGPSGPELIRSAPLHSARALSGGGFGQIDQEVAAAVAELAAPPFGLEPGDALDLVGRYPDGPARAARLADNARRLLAADFKFDRPPKHYVVKGMTGNWHRLSDQEVRDRAEWQRAKRGKPRPAAAADGFNVAPDAEVAARWAESQEHGRREAFIDALDDEKWAAVAAKVRERWPALHPNRPFPADSRKNVFVRAIARAILFGDQPAGVPR